MGLWWGGDYLGALVVAPALLSWARHTDGFVGRRPAVELALFAGGALLVAELVLGRLFPVSFLPQIEYPYLLFPLVIGAALRIGPRVASLATLVVAVRERVLRGEAVKGAEVTHRRKNGSPVTISLSVAPLYGADRQVAGMLAIAADLTEMRRLEVQYRQSQKLEAIGRLAGGIAHDFNNILTAILSTSELLLAEVVPASRVHNDVDEIRKAAQRAAGLTRQLLVFSRQQVLEPRVVDVNALVVEAQQLLRRLIG